MITENCISPYAKAGLAQCVAQPLATEPDAPGTELANVLESQIVGSAHPVLRDMYKTPGLNFHIEFHCFQDGCCK